MDDNARVVRYLFCFKARVPLSFQYMFLHFRYFYYKQFINLINQVHRFITHINIYFSFHFFNVTFVYFQKNGCFRSTSNK